MKQRSLKENRKKKKHSRLQYSLRNTFIKVSIPFSLWELDHIYFFSAKIDLTQHSDSEGERTKPKQGSYPVAVKEKIFYNLLLKSYFIFKYATGNHPANREKEEHFWRC